MGLKRDSDSDEDDVFYYRYSSSSSNHPQTQTLTATTNNKTSKGSSSSSAASAALAPSKSTLYVSNIDYSLTNSDLHTLFSTFGRIARVTVLKDRQTRLSRGVAFIQFVSRDDARLAAAEMHHKVLNGRTLSASIAVDNGRAPEFIRKRIYRDNGCCFECGESGHISYECPRNQLGPRQRPPPKRGRRGGGGSFRSGKGRGFRRVEEGEDEDEGLLDGGSGVGLFEDDNWASVVDGGADERLLGMDKEVGAKKKGKKTGYFSDESGDEDDEE